MSRQIAADLLLALVAATGPLLAAVETRPAPVPVMGCREAMSPNVDGRLDDAVWTSGEWVDHFVLLTRNDVSATPQTAVKLAIDGDHLYLAAHLAEPEPERLSARQPMGGALWKDDSLELFLDPYPQDQTYYQIVINSAGNWLASKSLGPQGPRLKEWSPKLQAVTSVGPRAWTVELALPLVSLGSVSPDGTWRFNVLRNRTVDGQVHTLARLTGVHQPRLFTPLSVPLGRSQRHLWRIGSPVQTAVREREGQLWLTTNIPIENRTDTFRFFSVHAELGKGGSAMAHGGMDTGLSKSCRVEIPVRSPGRALLRLALVDRVEPSIVYQTELFPLDVAYSPIRITMLQPAYRNSVYASYPLTNVQIRLDFDLPQETVQSAEVKVVVTDEEDKQWAAVTLDGPEPGAKVILLKGRLSELRPGKYAITVELTHGQSYRASVPLTVHAPAEHEVVIGQDGVLRVNGEPFVPVGWFTPYPPDYDEYRSEGYNFLTDYNAPFRTVQEEREQYLDEAARRGLKTMIYPWPRQLHYPLHASFLRDHEARGLAMIRKRVAALRDHPGLLAWYMADEPASRPETVHLVRRIYETVRAADPYHPCVILSDKPDKAKAHAGNGDILVADPYPGFLRGGHSARAMDIVRRDTTTWAGFAGLKPVWVTPQGHDLAVYGSAGHRAPDFAEIRNMAYQGLCAKAKGWLWFRWRFGMNWPAVKIGTAYVARELLALQRFILAGESPKRGRVKVEAPEGVYWTLREAGGQAILVVVNTRYEPLGFVLDGLPLSGALRVVSEERTTMCRRGRLADRLPPVGVRVYANAPRFDGERRLREVQREIGSAIAARGSPGNLAWSGRGVQAAGSSSSAYYAIDGCRAQGSYRFHIGQNDGVQKPPYWLELTFPRSVTIDRTMLWGSPLAASLHVPTAGEWRQIARIKIDGDEGTTSFAAVKTRKLRLETRDKPSICELEVYGPGGPTR